MSSLGKPQSLSEKLSAAKKLIELSKNEDKTTTKAANPLVEALSMLENLQENIQRASLFSVNESLTDIQTSSLPLLAVEYHMAKAYLQLRSTSSIQRNINVQKALELFNLFLHRCDTFDGILEEEIKIQYSSILSFNDGRNDDDESSFQPLPPQSRDDKIARYRRSKELQSKIARMNAQLSQRKRLDLAEHEELDGLDQDSLLRSLHLCQLNEWSLDCFQELFASSMELQMLQMAVKIEKERAQMDHHRGTRTDFGTDGESCRNGEIRMRPPASNPDQKMKLTQVTQDLTTGQLVFKRQEIRSGIFRPSWNQPTMSLEELGEKEVREAIEREARQKESELNAKNTARRYEFLVKDGLEDNADLVDQSAKLDRDWDDWKDENPRGSGNKLGDRGDRNF